MADDKKPKTDAKDKPKTHPQLVIDGERKL